MKPRLIYFIIITLWFGCVHRSNYSMEIEEVLKQAGKNRSQLEKY
jgi:hypothetical protein